jgi:hypothetical protein
MLHAILESQIRPSILIPLLEDMISMEMLLQDEYTRNHNETEILRAEMKITQLGMLLHILTSKAPA